MNRYLIVGCGFFGRRALRKLLEKDPAARIHVVDKDEKAIQRIAHLPLETSVEEAVSFLSRCLHQNQNAYIVPAVPVHLAFEFILSRSREYGWHRGRVPSLPGLPNPARGSKGDLYTSMAAFLCPEDCPEPAGRCTVTGEKRSKPLYQVLKNLAGTFSSRVIRSRQLGPGVGGFRARELSDLLEELQGIKPSGQPVLISTACRCHGVTSALTFRRPCGSKA
jgi:hypothetical protein